MQRDRLDSLLREAGMEGPRAPLTPECLTIGQLLTLIEQPQDLPERRRRHVLDCAYCRRAVALARQDQQIFAPWPEEESASGEAIGAGATRHRPGRAPRWFSRRWLAPAGVAAAVLLAFGVHMLMQYRAWNKGAGWGPASEGPGLEMKGVGRGAASEGPGFEMDAPGYDATMRAGRVARYDATLLAGHPFDSLAPPRPPGVMVLGGKASKMPLLVECTAANFAVGLVDKGKRAPAQKMAQFDGDDAPRAFLQWADTRQRDSEYFVLLVRPDAVIHFTFLVTKLRKPGGLGFDVFWDVWPEDKALFREGGTSRPTVVGASARDESAARKLLTEVRCLEHDIEELEREHQVLNHEIRSAAGSSTDAGLLERCAELAQREQAALAELRRNMYRVTQLVYELERLERVHMARVEPEEKPRRYYVIHLAEAERSEKTPVPILLTRGRVHFAFQYDAQGKRVAFSDDVVVSPDKKSITAKAGRGMMVADRDSFERALQRFNKDEHRLQVAVWPDSYEEFEILRGESIEAGFHYSRPMLMAEGEAVGMQGRIAAAEVWP